MTKFLCILAAFLTAAPAGDPEFILVKSIPVSSSWITTDYLGNIYSAKENTLEKYDPDGNLVKSFSNKAFGPLTSADAGNPLRILLLYKSFQQIVFLDNTLSLLGNTVSLDALGYSQTSLACTSHDNGFWIYNQQNAELIRFDEHLQKVQQTGSISQLTGTEIHPDFLLEQNGTLFLNDPEKGILLFDIYGTYHKTLPIRGLHRFQASGDRLIFLREGKLNSFHLRTLEENALSLPDTGIMDARTEKEKLYLLKQKSTDIYHVKNEK